MEPVFDPVTIAATTRAYRNRQLVQLILILVMLLVALVLNANGMIPEPWPSMDYVYLTGALLVFAVLVNTLHNWRCPGCSKALWRWLNPRYCPGCGIQLRK